MKRRPDGRWQKRITLPNGKSKLIYSSATSERMAVKDFNLKMMQLSQDAENSTLFENVAESWADETFDKVEHNTLKQYRPCYTAAVEYFQGYKINEIKPTHISQYINNLTSKKYAQKTIKNRLSVVSLIFKYALLNELIDVNPCVNISIPKGLPKTKRDKAIKEDENKICQNTDSLAGVLAYLYLTTGCRRGEALALDPADVDKKEMVLHINKTVEWIGNKPYIKDCPKTDAGIRDIPITEKLLNLLLPYMKQKYIFQNNNGELFGNSNFTRMWNKYKKEIGITCTPHQLRHSYATMLFDAGIDVKTAQRWLGHADINTTLAIYTHLSEQRQAESRKKLEAFLTTF